MLGTTSRRDVNHRPAPVHTGGVQIPAFLPPDAEQDEKRHLNFFEASGRLTNTTGPSSTRSSLASTAGSGPLARPSMSSGPFIQGPRVSASSPQTPFERHLSLSTSLHSSLHSAPRTSAGSLRSSTLSQKSLKKLQSGEKDMKIAKLFAMDGNNDNDPSLLPPPGDMIDGDDKDTENELAAHKLEKFDACCDSSVLPPSSLMVQETSAVPPPPNLTRGQADIRDANLEFDENGQATRESLKEAAKNNKGVLPGAYDGSSLERLDLVDYSHALVGGVGVRAGDPNNPSSRPFGSMASINENDKEEEESLKFWQKKRFWVVVVVTILLVIGVAIVIPVVVLPKSGSDSEADPTTIPPTPEWEKGLDSTLVPGLTNATIEALDDTTSPQFAAFDWAVRDPNWDSYEDWRKQQRFAVACMYHSFRGYSGFLRSEPTYFTSECDWTITQSDSCDPDGRVRSVGAGRTNSFETLKGSIPAELYLLSHLEVIDITAKQTTLDTPLGDLLPMDTINHLVGLLKEMKISHASLKGSIPTAIGLLTNLVHLDLSENDHLTSTIPSELGLLSNLTSLLLQSNDLSGNIPGELGDLPLLEEFNIEDNPSIEPFLPEGWCSEDHIPMTTLKADWCSNPAECCDL